jgi:hypothetical protein
MAATKERPQITVNAGDLVVLRRGQSGAAAGAYLVLELVEDRIKVHALVDHQVWTARVADVLADVVGLYRSALPAAAAATLDPRPEVKVAAAPAPEPTPPRLVLVHVINAGPVGYEITRPRTNLLRRPVTIQYKPQRVSRVDAVGQRHVEFEVDVVDVDRFLKGVPGSYRPATGPAELQPQFDDEERPEPDRRPLEEQLAVPLREPNPSGRPPAPQSGSPRRPRSGAPGEDN